VRVVSLILAIVFAVGGARHAWACPTQAEREGCCCDRARGEGDQRDARDGDDEGRARIERACCCKADTGTRDSSPPSSVQLSARERLAPPPSGVVVARFVRSQPVAERIVVATSSRGPPRHTLFGQHTLLLS
jgi:hypothetical protein